VSDREKHGLRGPAARVRTEHFECDQQTGEVSAQPRSANVFTFDREGRTTSRAYENPGGPTSTTNYTYNDRGDLARMSHDSSGEPAGDTTYDYDDAGRLLRTMTRYTSGGPERESSRFTYNLDGGKTEVRFGVSASEMAELVSAAKASLPNSTMEFGVDLPPATTTIHYDAKGNALEELEHDENHVLIRKTVHTYDDKGLLLETRQESGHKPPFSLPSNDPSRAPDEREALQRIIERVFRPGTRIEHTSYAYDDQGRKIEEASRHEPFTSTKSAFEYDPYGNVIAVSSVHDSRTFQATLEGELVDPTEEKQTISTNLSHYSYDQHGNWTEKIHLFVEPSTGKPKRLMVERRKIAYWQ
jgi:hypothetical protein